MNSLAYNFKCAIIGAKKTYYLKQLEMLDSKMCRASEDLFDRLFNRGLLTIEEMPKYFQKRYLKRVKIRKILHALV